MRCERSARAHPRPHLHKRRINNPLPLTTPSPLQGRATPQTRASQRDPYSAHHEDGEEEYYRGHTSNLIFFNALAPSAEGVSGALAAFLFLPASMLTSTWRSTRSEMDGDR